MITALSELSMLVRNIDTLRIVGEVSAITGLSLTVTGLERAMGIGQRCLIHGKQKIILGEVVGIDSQGTRVLPFGTWDGVAVGDAVELSSYGDVIRPDPSWVGRVMDALGKPLDNKGPLFEGTRPQSLKTAPVPAFDRRRVGERLESNIKTVDIFTPICRGQRMGVFAGSGVGKSTLMAMFARNGQADIIVVGLVGERGREVQDFIQDDLGAEGMKRTVLVVSTGDEPPLMRRQAAWTAMAVAEYFRDQGKQVLLLLDSVTRFAMAQREIGLSGGEPPTAKGYPPTVFSELPRLLERAGPGPDGAGDITGLFTVLVDGDDLNDPIADSVRGILDGHIVLDRSIAERGRYPAINIQKSISRMLPDCHSPAEYAVLQAARSALAVYNDMEELIRIGAYKSGTDPMIDAAIRFFALSEAFLSQRKNEGMIADYSFAEIYKLLGEAAIKVDLPTQHPVPSEG
ncbi:MAG: flagellar protein export ATPase FliI [Rhodobacteraceae bacterium]|nr:flagellar protein export ATPase FliI [Paracoccaceae bacterium]